MIVEGFVDDNSGEKKIGQAYDYASLISNPHESMILCTIHFDRNKKSTNRMKAVIECFIFVPSTDEPRREIGFLWREVYEVEPATTLESDSDFLKRCCPGIVRCLMCTEYLFTIASILKPKWSVISDNAAVRGPNLRLQDFRQSIPSDLPQALQLAWRHSHYPEAMVRRLQRRGTPSL
jgi:hypothetical protein